MSLRSSSSPPQVSFPVTFRETQLTITKLRINMAKVSSFLQQQQRFALILFTSYSVPQMIGKPIQPITVSLLSSLICTHNFPFRTYPKPSMLALERTPSGRPVQSIPGLHRRQNQQKTTLWRQRLAPKKFSSPLPLKLGRHHQDTVTRAILRRCDRTAAPLQCSGIWFQPRSASFAWYHLISSALSFTSCLVSAARFTIGTNPVLPFEGLKNGACSVDPSFPVRGSRL